MEELPEWECAARALWAMLDDIDTLPDVIKPVTVEDYVRLARSVRAVVEKRHAILETDGYVLSLPGRQNQVPSGKTAADKDGGEPLEQET